MDVLPFEVKVCSLRTTPPNIRVVPLVVRFTRHEELEYRTSISRLKHESVGKRLFVRAPLRPTVSLR